ncbi:MAG: TolC family protein [Acidobacteria bacterium]|nr:TolC family protein [Acidobacteriota bacterium]
MNGYGGKKRSWKTYFTLFLLLTMGGQMVALAQSPDQEKIRVPQSKGDLQKPTDGSTAVVGEEERGGSGIIGRSTRQQQSKPILPLPTAPQTPIYDRYVDQTNGVTYEALFNLAASRNRNLLAARQNLAIINGRLVQSGLRPNPTLDTEYVTDKIVGSGQGEYGISAAYIQPLELAGKRRKRLRVSQLELEQAEKELAFQEQQLAAEIRSQFAEALAATENLRITEQLIAFNEETLRFIQLRFTEGDAARLDVNLIRVEVGRLRAQLLQSENRVRTALSQLRTLAGLGSEENVRLQGALNPLKVMEGLTLEGLQLAAMQSRTDLQAARIGETAADARLRLAEAEAVPNINIFGRFTQDKSIFGLSSGGRLVDVDRKAAFGVSVPLPFFNRNQGAIAEAVATRAQTRYRREFLEQVIKRDVTVAFNRLQTAKEAIQLYETDIVPRSQENLQMIRTAYDLGDKDILDVIAEQRRLIETKQQYIDALKEYYLSTVELERALGTRISK